MMQVMMERLPRRSSLMSKRKISQALQSEPSLPARYPAVGVACCKTVPGCVLDSWACIQSWSMIETRFRLAKTPIPACRRRLWRLQDEAKHACFALYSSDTQCALVLQSVLQDKRLWGQSHGTGHSQLEGQYRWSQSWQAGVATTCSSFLVLCKVCLTGIYEVTCRCDSQCHLWQMREICLRTSTSPLSSQTTQQASQRWEMKSPFWKAL